MRRGIVILLAFIINFSLTSCQVSQGYSQNEQKQINFDIDKNDDDTIDKGPVKGGVLKIFSTYPDTLNPVVTNNIYVQNFSSLIFESLVKIGKDQRAIPVLADSWEVTGAGLVWTFHIRENVLWHDSKPLTAEDVEFTFETILNSNSNSVYKKNLQNITSFAAINRNTFRIILRKPNSFTAEFMSFPIIPKHYFSKTGMLKPTEDLIPIGTGPYKFHSYKKDNYIKLIANDRWWNSKNSNKDYPDFPYISEVNIKLYKDAGNAISAFQTRDVDVICIDNIEYDKYSGRSDLTIKKFPGRNFEFLAFNHLKPVLADKSVRQAIAYAIDKGKIINDILPGKVVPSDIPLIPGTWLNDTGNVFYDYDREKAGEILTNNGWKEGKSSLFKSINGIKMPLKLELLVNDDNELRHKVAESISEQLKEVGIEIEVTPISWDEEIKRINTRKFDMAIIGCTVPSIPDVSFLYSYNYLPPLLPAGAAGAWNIAGYDNARVAAYIEKIFSESDKDRKKALFINMRQVLNEEVPYIGLYFYNNAVLYSRSIRGDINPYVWDKLNNIAEWYIPVKDSK